MLKVSVVVPNWNGADSLEQCLDFLLDQTLKADVIVVDNGSVDDSLKILGKQKFSGVHVIRHKKNKGYAGGVNPGIRLAMENGSDYVAAFNNDAIAASTWLAELTRELEDNPEVGVVTCKLLSSDGKHIDSTGDYYTNWGLPYPRGRGETDLKKYDDETDIFAASGGASLYRISMLKEIGMFDENFFAYYEDVDLSFRAQLAGWKVRFVPSSLAYHQISATSSKIKGFATYQTMKNLPLLLTKNIPRKYIFRVWLRFAFAHTMFFFRAFTRGNGWWAIKGCLVGTYLLFPTLKARRRIQGSKKVSDDYIWGMMVHDLPPNARALRNFRTKWWKLRGKPA